MQLVKNGMITFRTQVFFFRKRGNAKRGKKWGEGARGQEEEGRGRKEARKSERREGMRGAEEEGKEEKGQGGRQREGGGKRKGRKGRFVRV